MATALADAQQRIDDIRSTECSMAFDDPDDRRLTESLERIVRAQNRLEQIRLSLESRSHRSRCRTWAGFIESVTRHLESSLDLVAVRVLLVLDANTSEMFQGGTPYGGGIVPGDLGLFGGESPFFPRSGGRCAPGIFRRRNGNRLFCLNLTPKQRSAAIRLLCLGAAILSDTQM